MHAQAAREHIAQVEMPLGPALQANDGHRAIYRQGLNIFLQVGSTHNVQNIVDPASVRQLADGLAKVLSAVVDSLSTQRPDKIALFIITAGGKNLQSQGSGQFDSVGADAAGATVNE